MKGLHVGIIGAGRSGIAAAKLLRRLGASVLLSDRGRLTPVLPKGIMVETGRHSRRLLDCDLIIRSPGVPDHLPILRQIRRQKIPIWSELELASRYVQSSQMIAITGTNGKTTTTSLVGELFKASGCPTIVAGNIGTPLSEITLGSPHPNPLPSARGEGEFREHPRPPQGGEGRAEPGVRGVPVVVLEVSSYQLENVETFHPTISAILNITPDHLEHHGTLKAYAEAKARIFQRQTKADVCVLNADDPGCRRLAKKCRAQIFWFSRKKQLKSGIYYENPSPRASLGPLPLRRGEGGGEGFVVIRWDSHRARWPLRTNLPGPHNVENVLAAVAIALAGGVPLAAVRRIVSRFQGVEHRLEMVRELRGVRYVNDSKATNVDSTRVALASFREPLIVIMGGEGKGSPYRPLRPLIKNAVKRILLIGEDAPTIKKSLKGAAPMECVVSMARAVRRAARLAQPGDVVLLSPACASFDHYRNYEERGRHFKALVRSL